MAEFKYGLLKLGGGFTGSSGSHSRLLKPIDDSNNAQFIDDRP